MIRARDAVARRLPDAEVQRLDGQLYNVEFDVQKGVKDPGKTK